MDFKRYHIISELFLTNDYRSVWRHQWRCYIYIKFVKKWVFFRKHFSTVMTEEIRIAKICTEVFVMPKHLMTKRNIPESSLYMSPLRAIVLSQQYCIITVIWSIIVLFAPLLNMRRCIVCKWPRSLSLLKIISLLVYVHFIYRDDCRNQWLIQDFRKGGAFYLIIYFIFCFFTRNFGGVITPIISHVLF